MSNPMNTLVNNLSYCAVSAVINGNKVLYVQKYPPVAGTKAPNMDVLSSDNELETPNVTKSDVLSFWNSNATRQVDGLWKGGKWAKNNLPTTDPIWLTDVFLGDELVITKVADGIIKMDSGKPFTADMPIIDNTVGQAWSCNVEYNGKQYGAYVTESIMPQRAKDVIFVWENTNNQQFIKLLTRGIGDSVDMPRRMMPGAGEHMEPGDSKGQKNGDILRAVNEEIGIDKSTLAQCVLLPLGTFSELGRDPRYWEYDGGSWGMKRGSETSAYVLYIKSETDAAPKEVAPQDTEEVNTKWWGKLSTVLSDYPEDRWMIFDHQKFIPATVKAVADFKALSVDEQEKMKFVVG
jgi:hypothetical protein